VLYEHASGYSLFRVREFEEIGMSLPQVEASVVDLSKFATVVKLVAFHPFQSGINALDNINAISEGRHTRRTGFLHGKERVLLSLFQVLSTMIFVPFSIRTCRKKRSVRKWFLVSLIRVLPRR
jgi:hypothetical protein